MTDQASSIAANVSQCYRSLEKLRGLLESGPREDINLSDIVDELGRFRVWAANIGAHRRGSISLDFRLRDALHIKERVQSLLRDLDDKVQQAVSIILGIKIPWNEVILESDLESDSDSTDGDHSNTADNDSELQQLLRRIHEKISLLSRLSMAIHNPAPEDQYISFVDVENWVSGDIYINHVVSKFPRISPGLAVNMGNAISRRRQSFAAHKSRHAKLSRGIELLQQVDDGRDARTEYQPQSTALASSLPEHLKSSLNSTFDQILEADMGSDASQTSFGTSLAGNNDVHSNIPCWPQEARNGNPIECPLCFMMIAVPSRDSWRRHVLRDLYPYLCTVEDCPTPNRMFSRRHEWFHHELQAHRQVWQCAQGCPGSFGTQTQFEAHARVQHPESISPELLVALSNLSVMPLNGDTPAECCFCHQQDLTLSKLERHLGRHQESLALFALPRIDQENDYTDEGEEDVPENKKRSSGEELSSQGNAYTVPEDEEIQESNAQISFDAADLRQAGKSSMVATASILRQFQLIIQVLDTNISATKLNLMDFHHLRNILQTLQAEDKMYLGSCDKLLDKIGVTKEQKIRMLDDASVHVWGDGSLEEQLNKISPEWYGSYTRIVEDLMDAFSRTRKLLNLEPDRKTQINDQKNRLKFRLRTHDFHEVFQDIMKNNMRFDSLVEQVDGHKERFAHTKQTSTKQHGD